MPADLALFGAVPVRSREYPMWPRPDDTVRRAVAAVVESGHWWQSGDGASERLEDELAAWFGVTRAVGVANGTVAIEIALRALGIGPGDEVLVPATTFVSTASAVAIAGAMPVPVDVMESTLNLDVEVAENAITARTRALIAVHLAGQPADLAAARALCDRRKLALIEDSAQAFGAEWSGERVGGAGDVTTLSFQAGKLLPGGDGGAILVRSDTGLARRIELIANCGRHRGSGDYHHTEIGTNGRIGEFSAAIVSAHLPAYEANHATRARTIARIADVVPKDWAVGIAPEVTRHDHYMHLLRVAGTLAELGVTNQTAVTALRAEGIPCQVLYPSWDLLPAFRGCVTGQVPVHSHCAADQVLWFHHRLLLDPDFPDDLAEVLARLDRASGELLRYQKDHE